MGSTCSILPPIEVELDDEKKDKDGRMLPVMRQSGGRLQRTDGPGTRRPPGEDPPMPLSDRAKWDYQERRGSQIAVSNLNRAKPLTVESRATALRMLQGEPHLYFGCHWHEEGWAPETEDGETQVTLFPRSCRFFRGGISEQEPAEAFGAMVAVYKQFVEIDLENVSNKDDHTEGLLASFAGQTLVPKCPGRLQGIADMPGLTVVGDVDPFDLRQGQLPDLWLMAALSAIAEFGPAAIKRLFKNTPDDISSMPLNSFNRYSVTLHDLKTWNPVDVEVDERLLWNEEKFTLMGVRPTRTGELWPCIVEKAVAVHLGGWECFDGGMLTQAWHMLTGCKEVYTITRNAAGRYKAFGAYNPQRKRWEAYSNAPRDQEKQQENERPDFINGTNNNSISNNAGSKFRKNLWPMAWPKVGGGGPLGSSVSEESLFRRMCAWDDANFMVCALGVKEPTQTKGVVVGYVFTVRQALDNVADSGFDMIQMRARKGIEEIQVGEWCDGGRNWDRYPDVFKACGEPRPRDDGIFWIQKEDFFKHFKTIYVCAMSMEAWAGLDAFREAAPQEAEEQQDSPAARSPEPQAPPMDQDREDASSELDPDILAALAAQDD